MPKDIKKKIKKQRQLSYLARDFDGFRAELLRYARTYFPDKIQDFSEASFGGLLLDMAAMIGDNMSFYLDHQFNETNWSTAIETRNIQRHIRDAGLKISGAAPAVADVSFFIEVPSESTGIEYRPNYSLLPKVLSETVVSSLGGVAFVLTEDVDFAEVDNAGNLTAIVTIQTTNDDGSPASYILEKSGVCISGAVTTETFSIPDVHVPFRTIALSSENINQIFSIVDTAGNTYYEVESLSQDNVFTAVRNLDDENQLVKDNLEIIPAPYRYINKYDASTKLSTLQFGGGNAESLDDDIIPDPSELALPLYGKRSFSRFSIDPNSLLDTHTLGIAPRNTTLTVKYRHGGGFNHNVPADNIITTDTLKMEFSSRASAGLAATVRDSVDIRNRAPATGGAGAPTLDDLRAQIPAARQMQNRIVSKEDLLARIYTMPSNFGRIFRAGIRANPNNPLASQLFVICRDADKNLDLAPDALKKNLRTYLNEFRLISDAIDVLDAQVVNYGIKFSIVVNPDANKNIVIQDAILAVRDLLKVENFQVGQPIVLADIVNVLINTTDVIALTDLAVVNIRGETDDRRYSDVSFNVDANTAKGMVIGPAGSIFELKYPDFDIIGSAS